MKLDTAIFSLFVSWAVLVTTNLHAKEDGQKLLIEGLQGNPEAFELIELNPPNSSTDFEVKLGESVVTLATGDKFDGFRFKAPEGAEGYDLVWYFNAPTNWAHWYLCPVQGEFERSFKGWFDADKLYRRFDRAGDEKRTRVLQTLNAGYFKSGQEYIMWFRKKGEGDTRLTGRFLFAKAEEKRDYDAVEEVLKLKPMAVNIQVDALKSRGGKILLDKEFFEKGYAQNRIDNVFYSIRHTKRMKGGFFITTEISGPTCNTSPSFKEIRKRYGEPDFVQTGAEKNTVIKHSGADVDLESNVITYYYDYFGFEVKQDDVKEIVQQVVTHASDFSVLRSEDKDASFAQVSLKNLTTFSKDGKEVGRMYYFLEGSKNPLKIKAPPQGRYKRGNQVLEFLGEGKWLWTTYFLDGSVSRQIAMKDDKMHGKAEGFHEGGAPSFVVFYKDGVLDGKAVKYNKKGEVFNETIFVDGKPQKGGR